MSLPVLLFNDECGVCRVIARWVTKTAHTHGGAPTLVVRPIGEDPVALSKLSPKLDIWEAYATIHLLMPDGSFMRGGEAVAEVLRNVPAMRWLTWTFSVSLFGRRPFQWVLDLAYAVLADIRPIFGCESCGTPAPWMRPFAWLIKSLKRLVGTKRPAHSTPRAAAISALPPPTHF